VCWLKFGCSFGLREGNLELIPNHPSTLIGLPFDRSVVGYGGSTVNTLRLWTTVHDYLKW
jgi:starch phosphorylase